MRQRRQLTVGRDGRRIERDDRSRRRLDRDDDRRRRRRDRQAGEPVEGLRSRRLSRWRRGRSARLERRDGRIERRQRLLLVAADVVFDEMRQRAGSRPGEVNAVARPELDELAADIGAISRILAAIVGEGFPGVDIGRTRLAGACRDRSR